MKTTKEWLEELPDGYRERALANIEVGREDGLQASIADALWYAFVWAKTSEEHSFWDNVYKHYNTPLPPLPENK